MAYLEFLRVKRDVLIFGAVVVVLAACLYTIGSFHIGDLRSASKEIPRSGIPVILFTSIAAWVTACMASILTASLNKQREHLAYTWTRPESRAAMAWGFIAVDVAGMLATFALVLLVTIACTALLLGVRIDWKDSLPDLSRTFGFALMWYAIVQAVTAGITVRGTMAAAISWPVFIVVAGFEAARFPSPWREIITFVNIFNPMAYLSHTQMRGNGDVIVTSILGFDSPTRLALMYGITIVALIVAVYTWKRMEA